MRGNIRDTIVKVEIHSFENYFNNKANYPVAIDSYQRPYVWGKEKIEELVADLKEYQKDSKGLEYYMGTILLHRNDSKEKLFVIDGQQRLTSLSVLYYVLKEKLPAKMELTYNSPLSEENIFNARDIFIAEKENLDESLFKNIAITCITTPSEDMAFTFFDTQNNRGVKLAATALLKAYHLRAIGVDTETIQRSCATSWEKMEKGKTIFEQNEDSVSELFHQFLWRARNWKGQRIIYRESYGAVLQEFQKQTLQHTKNNAVPLFPAMGNMQAKEIYYENDSEYRYGSEKKRDTVDSEKLPLTLRQPISKGLGFFLFSEKYSILLKNLLVNNKTKNKEILAFRELYSEVFSHVSLYLRELFLLSSVMYYDKFGSDRLFEFSLWLDHVLGAIRLEKDYVFKEAPIKFLKENQNNLLDTISHAFLPDEVIAFLKKHSKAITIYEEIGKENEIEIGKGVKGVYIAAVLEYFGRTKSLKNKIVWMNDTFIEEKLK